MMITKDYDNYTISELQNEFETTIQLIEETNAAIMILEEACPNVVSALVDSRERLKKEAKTFILMIDVMQEKHALFWRYVYDA